MQNKTAALRGFVLLCLFSALSFAQVSTGSVNGAITDPNGAAIPGAKVVATNNSTGQAIETVSSDAGLYLLPTLPVGTYTITTEKTGFKKLERQNIEVRIANRLTVDLGMEIGELAQTVEVTSATPLLETTTSEHGQNFSQKFMRDLPLFTGGIRNPEAFVGYMPGVNQGAEQSVSGSGGRGKEVLIDGGSLTIPESGGVVFNFPSAEMFSEFKLITGQYSAEYGRFGGGVEIFVAKSGTNDIHGTAFLNMRRDIWNANAWANNARGAARPKERLNEVGGAAGGPVYIPKVYNGRNKTFWYFTYTKDLRPATNSFPFSTVPTAAMKRGDFSELGNQLIYDPATTRTENGVQVRDPFPGNIIPANRFSNVSKNILPLIPDPNVARLTNNFAFVNTTVIDRGIWSLKGDHMLTANNRVSAFYSHETQLQNDIVNLPGPLGNGIQNTQKPWNLRVNHDYTVRPNFLIHTMFSLSTQRQGWDNPQQKGWASRIGIPGITGEGDSFPRIRLIGAAGFLTTQPNQVWAGVGDGKVSNGGQNNDTRMITQGFSWLTGKHEFKFGWDLRFLQTEGFDYAGSNGFFTFNRNQTAVPGSTVGSGHEFASFLLGSVDQAENTVLPVLFPTIKYRYTSGYFQDNWKVTRKLTLNLGVRYEVPINWHATNGDYSHIDLTVPNSAAGGRPGALVFAGQGAGRTGKDYFWPTDYSSIGPRLGFAYQLFSKTVLRGGWGIYYQTLGNGGCGCREGFANSNAVQPQGYNPSFNWDAGIPVLGGFRQPPVLDPTWGNFKNVDFMGPTFGRAPRIYNWSFNIQHEIKNWLVDIAYVGNRGSRLNSTLELNQLPVSALSLGSLLTQPINSPAAQAANLSAPFANFGVRNVNQALRPYPQFLSVTSRNAGIGRTWYDSLQTKLERRFGNFQFMGAYTWSKSLGQAHFRQIFSQGAQVAPQDAYNPADSKSYLPFDQPHVLNILYSYDLPFGRGQKIGNTVNHFVNAFIGGWTISGAHRYYSGNLIQVITPGNPLGATLFAPNTKAIRNGNTAIQTGIDKDKLDPNNPSALYFNPGAFSSAAPFSLGTAAYYFDDFRQPAIAFENVSLAKRTTLFANDHNPVILTYRADAFNLFNRSKFGGVNGVIGNPNFGRTTGPQVGARAITMGLRLEF